MTLYTDLGGQEAIDAALEHFYGRVLADPAMRPYFDDVDVERVKSMQRVFLAMAFGGPAEYQGRDLRTAHQRAREKGLDEDHFERFLGHFRATLVDLGVPAADIERAMDVAYGARDEVLGR